MDLIKAVAIAFHEDSFLQGKWPEPAERLYQSHSYMIQFDDEVELDGYTSDCLEVENIPWISEYDSGDCITKEEYNKFLQDNPNWYQEMLNNRPNLIAQIAELNKEIAEKINLMDKLAEEAGVELNIDLGVHGSLDPNSSSWLSSNC